MLRMSLQLEMGTFSAAVCGLVGVAFGMNLDSSLEGVCIRVRALPCACYNEQMICSCYVHDCVN